LAQIVATVVAGLVTLVAVVLAVRAVTGPRVWTSRSSGVGETDFEYLLRVGCAGARSGAAGNEQRTFNSATGVGLPLEQADRPAETPMRLSRYSPKMISGSS
jgi:hypothetical protein